MPSDELRKRLEALNGKPLENVPAARRAPESAEEPAPASRAAVKQRPRRETRRAPETAASASFAPLESCLPGAICTAPGGRLYYHIDRPLVEHAPWSEALGDGLTEAVHAASPGSHLRAAAGSPDSLLFLDLETLGLHGEPVFLIGAMRLGLDGRVRCRQFLARSYAEEAGVVAAFAEMLPDARVLVTFNGASFDVPMLRARAAKHGIPLPESWAHLDVCVEARRQYAREVPNCKLQTLEQRICGRSRTGDVPGAQIPRIYREFLRTGNAAELALVIQHNLLDLATTAELVTHL